MQIMMRKLESLFSIKKVKSKNLILRPKIETKSAEIYLAKVTRVEPSLQAAFVEYGGNRHGFLAFNEIHPDYYQIPTSERKKLLDEETELVTNTDASDDVDETESDEAESVTNHEGSKRSSKQRKRYKIQEVIKKRQIILVQVTKEERGNKGAALTSYISLAGRYCVLMPNTARGGGNISKDIRYSDKK